MPLRNSLQKIKHNMVEVFSVLGSVGDGDNFTVDLENRAVGVAGLVVVVRWGVHGN